MAAFTWRITPITSMTVAAPVANSILEAIRSKIDAHSSEPGAIWEVVAFSTSSPRYVLRRRKSGAPGRIILFGEAGAAPSASACRNSATSYVFMAFHPTSTANVPDASWLSAAPLSGANYIRGTVVTGQAAYTGQINYAEFADGIVIFLSDPSAGISVAAAGEIIEKLDGTYLNAVLTTGDSFMGNWLNPSSQTQALIDTFYSTDATNYVFTYPALFAAVTSPGGNQLFRLNRIDNPSALYATATAEHFLVPILITGNSSQTPAGVVGKMRQIAFGFWSLLEMTWLDSTTGTLKAYGRGYNTGANMHGFWLTNIEV
jgi:hypothetical protein